jgi:GTP-binding protein
MAVQNFVDRIRVLCRSGNGGAGSVHFHRDKLTSKGGPDGGDGGRGGHVILRGNRHIWTLLHLRYQKHLFAQHGEAGTGNLSTGADGKDIIIEVPLGTIARYDETDEFILEITEHNQKKILLDGGMGGLGNDHFKTSTNQTPQYAQPGIPGKEAWIVLELKMLADVGLVGFPNAGKSTLLSVVSAARPKIADYAFTTLVPNVGVVGHRELNSFVMADIPGIIEGAHEGKGLGIDFLRHIERNSVLLFMVSAEHLDVMAQYEILLNELDQYNPALLLKKRLLAVSKSDLLDEELTEEIKKNLPDIPCVFISSVTGKGIVQLKDKLWEMLTEDTN